MSGITIGILGAVCLIALILAGIPIAFALGSVGFVGVLALRGVDQGLAVLASTFYARGTNYVYIAVPFFIWLGFLCANAGLSRKLYDTMGLWLGKLKGGLGIATTLGCTVFGAINGSSMVTATVFGKVAAPEMRRHGYDKNIAFGICAAAGLLGQLIPPSNFMVNYGVISGQSIGVLLMAGIAPGVIISLVFCITIALLSALHPELVPSVEVKATWKERLISLRHLIPFAIIALVVIGGIFSGIFSVAESAAVAAMCITIIAIVQRRPFKEFLSAGLDAMLSTCMTISLLASGMVFAKFLSLAGVVTKLTQVITALNPPAVVFMIMVVISYIILGCFIDITSMITITLPIYLPIAEALGINWVHFAMVATIGAHMGVITPPVGLNVFAVKAIADDDVETFGIFKGSSYFLAGMILVCLLFILIPQLSTFIPGLMSK